MKSSHISNDTANKTNDAKMNRFLSPFIHLLFDYKYFSFLVFLLISFELFLGVFIILNVKYTEIDWKAYMEQISQFLDGERNYINIYGGTGPLVYPGGFVYLFSIIQKLTDDGTNILKAQFIYLGIYLLNLLVVFGIYYRTRIAPPWAAILLCLSRRMHSIYYLRLFNDCFSMFFLYVSIYLFLRQKWRIGCLFYSIAVSIKMNILLFAPALFFLLLKSSGAKKSIEYLTLCAIIQLIAGLPFLKINWFNYISKAFEFNRVFFYKWTVNWKLISEESFLSKRFAITLLLCHILFLIIFLNKVFASQYKHGLLEIIKQSFKSNKIKIIPTDLIVTSLFISNFIGICFSRTLHYQFYSWYHATLPYLLWKTNVPNLFKITFLIGIEFGFNVFPSTPLSSLILQCSHFSILIGFYFLSNKKKIAYLDFNTREELINHMNKEHQKTLETFAYYYGIISKSDIIQARMTSIDEYEMSIYLPQKKTTLIIGFGDYGPITNAITAKNAIIQMAKEAANEMNYLLMKVKDITKSNKTDDNMNNNDLNLNNDTKLRKRKV